MKPLMLQVVKPFWSENACFFNFFAILTWLLILGKIPPRRRPRWRSLLVTSQASSSATTYKLYFMLREDQRLSTKGRTFRNTATYQKLRGGVPSTPSPCTTVGVWICVYVRLLINPNQHFMDFQYYCFIRKCEKRFVKLSACKTTDLENSFQ